jgi:hypothetical protein
MTAILFCAVLTNCPTPCAAVLVVWQNLINLYKCEPRFGLACGFTFCTVIRFRPRLPITGLHVEWCQSNHPSGDPGHVAAIAMPMLSLVTVLRIDPIQNCVSDSPNCRLSVGSSETHEACSSPGTLVSCFTDSVSSVLPCPITTFFILSNTFSLEPFLGWDNRLYCLSSVRIFAFS